MHAFASRSAEATSRAQTAVARSKQAPLETGAALNKHNAHDVSQEDNVVLYKTEGGKRKALDVVGRAGGYGVTEKVVPGRWHTLRVEYSGARFKVIFDGKALFEEQDRTFPDAGLVGVWTKADSVTLFDDFSYGMIPTP